MGSQNQLKNDVEKQQNIYQDTAITMVHRIYKKKNREVD
jgi:hypothetical protein